MVSEKLSGMVSSQSAENRPLVRDTHGGVAISRSSIPLKEFRLSDWKIDGNGFSFSFPTLSGTYRIEHSPTLPSSNWNPIGTVIGTRNQQTFTNRNVITPEGYYRVRKE